MLQACATRNLAVSSRVDALLPTEIILLGEQHDAPEHQRLQRELVQDLARRGQLAALVIEMALQGRSTAGLAASATQSEVQAALGWNDAAWPWATYGAVVMAAVNGGVPVLGSNLAREAMRSAMADQTLDAHLSPSRLEQQRESIRSGHCRLLPEGQVAPMARIQIARDAAMAGAAVAARRTGKTVLLIAGGAHVARDLGVPTHLPATVRYKVVLAVAGRSTNPDVDVVWETPAVTHKDHCAELEKRLRG